MQQPDFNDRHGYIFHDACWQLLKMACHPAPVPIEKFHEVCASLPFPMQGTTVSWGHDFVGLVAIDNESRFPWEDRARNLDLSGGSTPANRDPLDVPEIKQILNECGQPPPESSFSQPPSTTKDDFFKLPEELRLSIASLLSTVDALNARRASRAFWTAFYSQQFWASRFGPHSDRSWLFETWNSNPPRDWRWLYRQTSPARLSLALQNRNRVGKLVQQVANTLKTSRGEDSFIASMQSRPDGLDWIEAGGDVRATRPGQYQADFNEGCRVFHKDCVQFPTSLTHIVLYFVNIGDLKNIAGIRLVEGSGESVQLGYQTIEKEEILALCDLRGINLALASRGIQAIQLIPGKGHASSWYGDLRRVPQTQRLNVDRKITSVEVGFDVSALIRDACVCLYGFSGN